MAINKLIKQIDGINTEYHRIVRLEIIVNNINIIEVASYVNHDSRKQQIENENTENYYALPYMVIVPYSIPYDETMSVEGAYNALKQLPEFEGATDVFEEGQVLSLSEE